MELRKLLGTGTISEEQKPKAVYYRLEVRSLAQVHETLGMLLLSLRAKERRTIFPSVNPPITIGFDSTTESEPNLATSSGSSRFNPALLLTLPLTLSPKLCFPAVFPVDRDEHSLGSYGSCQRRP